MSATEGVAATAAAAARGKQSVSRFGYSVDRYVSHFSGRDADEQPTLGAMINRGQYARVAAIDSVLEQFLAAAGSEAQVVSLGAGFDTRFWQLAALGRAPRLYVELDQPKVVAAKASIVLRTPSLLAALPEGRACLSDEGASSAAGGYHLAATDLADLARLEAGLHSAGWDAAAPTLVLAECVLVYMPPAEARSLLGWFAARCRRLVLAAYEQVGPDDPFGRMMMSNLRARGCPLLGLPACPSVDAQRARALEMGYRRAECMDMLRWFDAVLSSEERRRVCGLELLDEVEEWQMLQRHYCVLLAVREGEEEAGTAGGDCSDQTPSLFGALALAAPVERPPLQPEPGTASFASPFGATPARRFEPGELQPFAEEGEEGETEGDCSGRGVEGEGAV